MDQAGMDRILGNGLEFLKARLSGFYGTQPVRFELVSHYADFDGMLKREIVYSKYDALELIAEARISVGPSAFEAQVHVRPLTPYLDERAAPEPFSVFLVRRRFLTLLPGADYHLVLPGFEADVDLSKEAEERFSIRSLGVRPRPGRLLLGGPRESSALEDELEAWFREALVEWTFRVQEPRILSWKERPPENPAGRPTKRIGAWGRISQVDIDSSGEEVPHVFRWQDAFRFSRAAYADLTEAECLAVLKAHRASVPSDSRLVGISRNDIDEGIECVALRYAHILPDLDPGAPEAGWATLRNSGAFVVENDFWEFHIDASDRTLIGEYRKWRAIDPNLAA